MNEINITIHADGSIEPDEACFAGYDSSHNASVLKIKLSEIPNNSAIDHYRLTFLTSDFKTIVSDKLYLVNQEIVYPLISDVMVRGELKFQLSAVRFDGEEVSYLDKSPIIKMVVRESLCMCASGAGNESLERTLEADVKKLEKLADKIADSMEKGLIGPPGASAYDLAVSQGFTGTLDDWLASLKQASGINNIMAAVPELNCYSMVCGKAIYSDPAPQKNNEIAIGQHDIYGPDITAKRSFQSGDRIYVQWESSLLKNEMDEDIFPDVPNADLKPVMRTVTNVRTDDPDIGGNPIILELDEDLPPYFTDLDQNYDYPRYRVFFMDSLCFGQGASLGSGNTVINGLAVGNYNTVGGLGLCRPADMVTEKSPYEGGDIRNYEFDRDILILKGDGGKTDPHEFTGQYPYNKIIFVMKDGRIQTYSMLYTETLVPDEDEFWRIKHRLNRPIEADFSNVAEIFYQDNPVDFYGTLCPPAVIGNGLINANTGLLLGHDAVMPKGLHLAISGDYPKIAKDKNIRWCVDERGVMHTEGFCLYSRLQYTPQEVSTNVGKYISMDSFREAAATIVRDPNYITYRSGSVNSGSIPSTYAYNCFTAVWNPDFSFSQAVFNLHNAFLIPHGKMEFDIELIRRKSYASGGTPESIFFHTQRANINRFDKLSLPYFQSVDTSGTGFVVTFKPEETGAYVFRFTAVRNPYLSGDMIIQCRLLSVTDL